MPWFLASAFNSLSFLNSTVHPKRPSIFHVPSTMLALLQFSPLIHINSSPTSSKRKKPHILVLFYPSEDPTLIHYPQTSVNLPTLHLPPVSSDIQGEKKQSKKDQSPRKQCFSTKKVLLQGLVQMSV